MAIKPKIIPSLSVCKNHSINLLNSSNHLWDKPDLIVPYKALLIFDHAYPKIIKVTYSFLQFTSACKKKKSSFHQFILEIQQILKSQDLKGDTHFRPPPSKNYLSNFWLSWIFINTPNISLFHWFLLAIQPIFLSCNQSGHTHF